jgi:hypothetical protein
MNIERWMYFVDFRLQLWMEMTDSPKKENVTLRERFYATEGSPDGLSRKGSTHRGFFAIAQNDMMFIAPTAHGPAGHSAPPRRSCGRCCAGGS